MSKKNKHVDSLQNGKIPRAGSIPVTNKIPRIAVIPDDHCQPEFRTDQMDVNGQWGWDKLDAFHLQDLLKKIFHSQKLTWQILRDNGSHLVEVPSLVTEAQKRLKDLEKDDFDHLYSLRLSGQKRVWGIKEGRFSGFYGGILSIKFVQATRNIPKIF